MIDFDGEIFFIPFAGFENIYMPPKPTVCLFVASKDCGEGKIEPVVRFLINAGCKFFAVWGGQANVAHDVIDGVIESGCEEWLDIITTSHLEEELSDIMDFLLEYSMPGNRDFRFVIVGDDFSDEIHALLKRKVGWTK